MRTEADAAGAITALGELWLELLFGDAVVRGARADVICSPAGLWLALAALEACADGATRTELRGVVGPVGARNAEGAAVHALGREGAFVASARMSSRLPARPGFRMPSYAIEVGQPGLDAPHGQHGLHRQIRGTDGLFGQAAACAVPARCAHLLSTVALQAEWERPFEPSFTRELPFTDAEGVTHRVPAMVAEVPVEDAWTVERPHGRVTVVELRARGGSMGAAPATRPVRVRFAVGEGRQVPPAEVISASWAPATRGSALRGSRGSRHPEAVLLELPRMWLSGDIDVAPHLAALGVKRLFSGSAELPRMFSEPVHVDRAVQSCRVRLDEAGMTSEIAADTAKDRPWANGAHFDGPGQLLRTAPVRLDRPFAVSVLDGSGTIPLLAGYQADRPGAP